MLPYLLWPAFFACFFEGNVLFSDFTLPSIIHRLFEVVTNHNGLWFLIVFWSLSIIGYIVTASGNTIQSKRTKIISEVLLLFMLLAFTAALHKLFPAYLLWKQIITYGPFFFLGVYIHRYESLQKIVSTKLAYTVGWILLFTAASQFKGDNPVYRLLGGIGAIPAFLYAARNIVLPNPYKKWLMTFGQYSLAIYIVHYFFLTISSDIRLLAFFTELTQWWLTFTAIFFSIIIACCCVLFAKFIATIPLLNLLLFGKNK